MRRGEQATRHRDVLTPALSRTLQATASATSWACALAAAAGGANVRCEMRLSHVNFAGFVGQQKEKISNCGSEEGCRGTGRGQGGVGRWLKKEIRRINGITDKTPNPLHRKL